MHLPTAAVFLSNRGCANLSMARLHAFALGFSVPFFHDMHMSIGHMIWACKRPVYMHIAFCCLFAYVWLLLLLLLLHGCCRRHDHDVHARTDALTSTSMQECGMGLHWRCPCMMSMPCPRTKHARTPGDFEKGPDPIMSGPSSIQTVAFVLCQPNDFSFTVCLPFGLERLEGSVTGCSDCRRESCRVGMPRTCGSVALLRCGAGFKSQCSCHVS